MGDGRGVTTVEVTPLAAPPAPESCWPMGMLLSWLIGLRGEVLGCLVYRDQECVAYLLDNGRWASLYARLAPLRQ